MSATIERSGRGAPSASEVAQQLREGRQRKNVWHLASGAAVMLLGLTVPRFVDSLFYLNVLVQATFLAILSVGIGFLFRQLGRVSFGHAAFYGLSAYIVALGLSRWDLGPLVTLVGAVAASTLLAVVVGLLIMRVSGVAFAMLTLAFGQSLYLLSTRLRNLTGGFDGISLRYPESIFGLSRAQLADPNIFWYIAWGGLALVLLLVWLVHISPLGRLLLAIKDNEERARFCGYRTYLPRVAGFTVSGAIAGFAGALFALKQGFVSPEMLFWTMSGEGLIVAILGGTASMSGPVLGAFTLQFGRSFLLGQFEYWRSILGVLLIAVIFFAPGGFVGIVERLWVPFRARSASSRLRDEDPEERP